MMSCLNICPIICVWNLSDGSLKTINVVYPLAELIKGGCKARICNAMPVIQPLKIRMGKIGSLLVFFSLGVATQMYSNQLITTQYYLGDAPTF